MPNNGKLDIHNYERKYAACKHQIEIAEISQNNKKFILEFDQHSFIKDRISLPRRIKLMGSISLSF